jgi:hypothetical protein
VQRSDVMFTRTTRLSNWSENVMFTVTSSMNAVLHKVYKKDVGTRGVALWKNKTFWTCTG